MKKCVCGHEMTQHEWKGQWVCHRCGRTKKIKGFGYEKEDRSGAMSVEELGPLPYLRELAERDQPMKPYKESLADRNCARCGAGISWDALNDPMEYAPAFCSNCGQRIDWSEEEKYC